MMRAEAVRQWGFVRDIFGNPHRPVALDAACLTSRVVSLARAVWEHRIAHDPTQLDRQGPDVGPQYRSAIFVEDDRQRRVAESYIAQLGDAKVFRRPIVTRVDNLTGFYPAEAYHQDFLARNPRHPYILINDLPKVANLKRLYPSLYRASPVLVAS